MVGGAADLVESTRTAFDGAGVFSPDFAGRNIPFGDPRARDGRDRQRPRAARRDREAVRLDVPHLQRLHAPRRAPVGAHEPAGRVGLDARLGRARRGRADPPAGRAPARRCARSRTSGSMRPADANETTYAWKVALEREDGPVALILSRQDLPVARRAARVTAPTRPASSAAPTCSGSRTATRTPDVDPARDRLGGLGRRSRRRRRSPRTAHAVRVVSMPCWELFEAQPAAYRDEVLPPECRRARSPSRPASPRAGSAGSATGATTSRSSASAPRRRARPSSRSSASPPAQRRTRGRALRLLERALQRVEPREA